MPRNRKKNRQEHNRLKRGGLIQPPDLVPVTRLMITPVIADKQATIKLQVVTRDIGGQEFQIGDLPLQNVASGDTLYVDFPTGQVSLIKRQPDMGREIYLGWKDFKDDRHQDLYEFPASDWDR